MYRKDKLQPLIVFGVPGNLFCKGLPFEVETWIVSIFFYPRPESGAGLKKGKKSVLD